MAIGCYIETPDHGFTHEIEQIASSADAKLVLPAGKRAFFPHLYTYVCTSASTPGTAPAGLSAAACTALPEAEQVPEAREGSVSIARVKGAAALLSPMGHGDSPAVGRPFPLGTGPQLAKAGGTSPAAVSGSGQPRRVSVRAVRYAANQPKGRQRLLPGNATEGEEDTAAVLRVPGLTSPLSSCPTLCLPCARRL